MTYDYRSAEVEDIKSVIDDYDYYGCSSIDEAKEWLNDQLWVNDSVTGNGSGSYTFSRARAEECLIGNMHLLVDAMEDYGCVLEDYKHALTDPEWCDVVIRCYLLGECIEAAFRDPAVRRKVMARINGGR